jgi:tetratricopeptide (TPR) repeat protein
MEAKRRQEEFERSKQEALKSMKGITEGELGLKGIDDSGLGLKDIGDTGTSGLGLKDVATSTTQPKKMPCEWGTMDSSVVDLRCLGLDPNKPITIDPHVVRGKERVFPAQIDPKTFENANYNKGFEALMHFDVASAAAAVEYFKQAQKERPNDPLVRNALLLAQDILKARQKKEEDNKARAAELTRQTYAALMIDERGSARSYITRARELDPDNSAIRFLDSTLAIIGPESVTAPTPEKRSAYKLVGHSLVSIATEDYAAATSMLEVARKMAPDDPFIARLFIIVSNYEAGRAAAETGK